jgi:hypothetical protein
VPIDAGNEGPVGATVLQSDPKVISGATSIAINETGLYWANNYGTTVVGMPLDGGAPVTLATAQDSSGNIRVDAQNVYFAAGGAVRQMPLAGVVCEDVCP